jgi:hypothetical protein
MRHNSGNAILENATMPSLPIFSSFSGDTHVGGRGRYACFTLCAHGRSSPRRSSSASVSENFLTGLRTDLRGAKHPIKKMFTPAHFIDAVGYGGN